MWNCGDNSGLDKLRWLEVYVDRDGYVAKVYNLQDNKLELYSGTTITTAANTECVLSDGYNYLFNIDGESNGSRLEAGWKQ